MRQPAVLFNVDEGVAIVALNDAECMSPLGEDIIAGLRQAVEAVHADKAVRAVVLTGRGRGFCVGADLKRYRELLERPKPGESLGQYVGGLMASVNPVIQGLRELPVPVVCAVNGVAAGGGVGLALAGDMTIAARSAYFYLPFFPALGAVPDMGASWMLPRMIGRARAVGLALTGEKLPAQRAADWGLIWACVEDAQLEAEAMHLARQLAAMPAHAIAEARALFAAAEVNSFAGQLALERARQIELIDGESFAEGVRAFSERRKPRFPGR